MSVSIPFLLVAISDFFEIRKPKKERLANEENY